MSRSAEVWRRVSCPCCGGAFKTQLPAWRAVRLPEHGTLGEGEWCEGAGLVVRVEPTAAERARAERARAERHRARSSAVEGARWRRRLERREAVQLASGRRHRAWDRTGSRRELVYLGLVPPGEDAESRERWCRDGRSVRAACWHAKRGGRAKGASGNVAQLVQLVIRSRVAAKGPREKRRQAKPGRPR